MDSDVFKFKTRGSSTPNRKPKVYFFSHADDFDKYFDIISDDILASQNCSVWYIESDSLSIDNMTAFNLDQMQLFVVPVTRRFLTDDKNPGIEILQYAMRQGIPILPIMVDVELDYLYAEKFHNMQYLDRVNQDLTAIPYPVKLAKFLSQVLISDEDAERIRSAFGAYIFLSYRKKDRQFAQKIMKLIHKDEFCERIAIWYDEFLVPGEDFDTAIMKALEKSNLFSLAVTPNIVNEENYVMNAEYPMARNLNKPILPIEIVPTDRGALYEHYLDVPEPVSAFDALELHNKLRDMLHAATSSVDDANHDFLIGLAYLSGIDVEVDREKGIKLIEKAAEAGLDEAVRKLVVIYSTGNGSAQDYEKAYTWEERLVEKYEDIAEKSCEYRDILVFWEELMNFVDLADSCGDTERAVLLCERGYDTARKVCLGGTRKMIAKRIFSFLKRTNSYTYGDEKIYYLLKFCRLTLKFYYDIDIRERVEEWVPKMISLVNIFEKYYDFNLPKEEFFAAYYELAEICIKNEKYDNAKMYVKKMSAILIDMMDEEDSVDFKIRQVALYQKEGEVYLAVGDLARAHFCQRKCTDLLIKIADEYPEDAAIALRLIEAWNKLGAICCNEQDEKGAGECLNAALGIIEDFKGRGYDWEESLSYARLLMLSGDIFILGNYNEKALVAYHSAYKIFSCISENTLSAQVVRDRSHAALQMGDCHERSGRQEEAARWYMQSRNDLSEIFTFSRSVMDGRLQAAVCVRLWNNAICRDNPVLEKEWYEKALFMYRELVKILGSEYDKKKLNDLTASRERLRKEGKIGSIDWDDPSNFAQYIIDNPMEYDESTRMYIETEIGKLLEKYWQVNGCHMSDRNAMAFTRLARMLKRSDHENGMGRYTSIILNFFWKQNNVFTEYDECAALIINFCGCYGIDCSRYMIGGKEQEMKDYWEYYCGAPFWVMPVQRIQYPDLWRAIHAWIMALRRKL